MTAPTVSDVEFVKLYQECGSPAELSKKLGVAIRNIYGRRRRLETKMGITLKSRRTELIEVAQIQHSRANCDIKNGTVIVFSDAHFWPGIYSTAYRALLALIKELKPSVIVNNGDAFDGASISRWPRIGWDNKPSVRQELDAVDECLAEIESVRRGAKLFWPLGNHDARFENILAAKVPEFEGVRGFTLKDNFPAWKPCWLLQINGDTIIKHRHKGGVHATRNSTLNAGRTMVTGHLHSLKVAPLTDYNGTRWGVDTGTLADPVGPQFEDYTEANPSDWRSGFVVLTYHNGRLLWPEVCHVIEEGKAEFRGRIIEV